MVNLLKSSAYGATFLLLAGTLFAASTDTYTTPANNPPRTQFAQAGTVNYVEGQVNLDGQALTPKSIGSVIVDPGHAIRTGANGKAEMLLTPGVFFRIGPNSTVKMISPSLTDTRVQLVAGSAMMEVADFHKENHLQVTMPGSEAVVEKHGLYEFAANPPMARVYDGKLRAMMDNRTKDLTKGDQAALVPDNSKLKTQSFDLKQTENSDDLYAWSKLRADYTAQANMSAAETYFGDGPGYYASGWYGAGWYWDPYFDQYAFLLGDGFLWDPFGYGFFSPGYWGAWAPYYGAGFYGHGYYGRGLYGHGIYGHGFHGHPGGAITRGSAPAIGGGFHGGFRGGAVGGFHGAPMGGFRGGFGGGFHGGFGGFHGGGGRR